MSNLRTEYRFKSLAAISEHLRKRSAEIKEISQERQIDKARNISRALAYEEVAHMIDNSVIDPDM